MKMVGRIDTSITAARITVITSLVAALHLITAQAAVAQSNLTQNLLLDQAFTSKCASSQCSTAIAPDYHVSSFTQIEDYEPPDNGGPEKSGGGGGAGTR